MNDQEAFTIALEEAKISLGEGGVPIGAVLVSADGTLLGRGHNERVQKSSPILHAETSALQNSGRLPASAYQGATMYTTLSPCDMCTGACLLYGISRVVIGENKSYLGGEAYLKQRGVEVVVIGDEDMGGMGREARFMMEKFIEEKPGVWNEDVGSEERIYSKS